ncbi:hypothetical protein E2C01_027029 [Portunus trituberculatus]|uniref:Uncharacterized protein n=1 Tax=Portunus trituberculatus TaxID=210409 RepID=A0A5B7EH35_PORTR|nr:hypothetical protein [Portunus trituberculatus]
MRSNHCSDHTYLPAHHPLPTTSNPCLPHPHTTPQSPPHKGARLSHAPSPSPRQVVSAARDGARRGGRGGDE